MPLFLNESTARRRFKDLLGQANHLLITILVGLRAVELRLITEAPPDLHTIWNPRDPVASASRSRVMLLGMTLVRATDAIDAYISWSRRTPTLIQSVKLQQDIDRAQQSVLQKFNAVKTHLSALDFAVCAMIEVMIVWRNRSVHSLADNQVSAEATAALTENQERIRNEFSGLAIDRLFEDFEKEGSPTFKEIASFIRAAHLFVEQVDQQLISQLNARAYLAALLLHALTKPRRPGEPPPDTVKILQSIWGRDRAGKINRLRNLLVNVGLSDQRSSDYACEFPDDLIEEIVAPSAKHVLASLRGMDH
jgi:hypothetical protein